MKTRKKKRGVKILIAILLVLIAIRIALPYVVLHYGNKALAEMKGYYGHMEDVDLAIYKGAYIIKDVYINKVDSISNQQTDFFKAKNIDLSIEWNALFEGSLVGELQFNTAELIFTKDKVEPGEVKNDSSDFKKILKGFMPLKVNKFEINESKLRYVDKSTDPQVDVYLDSLHVLATNLTNVVDGEQLLPSTVTANAILYKGRLNAEMKLDVLAEEPTFDLTTELNNTDLTELNKFFDAYGKFDVNKGEFGLYTEFAAKDGNFKGYVKPFLKDLDVRGKEDKNDGFLRKAWESIIGTAGDIFKNQKKDQVATKVPIEGSFDNPDVLTLEAIWQILKNAFIEALMPTVDQQISITSVDEDKEPEKKGLIKRIFGSKDDKHSDNKKSTE